MARCKQVVLDIQMKVNNPNIFCEPMDLSSLRSVKNFCDTWKKRNLPLHILVNNAGIMSPYDLTIDGHEIMFGTNHLGHFLLTTCLMDNLKQGTPSKVITVGSEAHHFSELHLDDLIGLNTWRNGTGLLSNILGSSLNDVIGDFKAYGASKTANLLFALELAKKMEGFGISFSLHPGAIRTNLGNQHNKDNSFVDRLLEYSTYFLPWKSVNQGASTTIYMILKPNLKEHNGKYFCDCRLCDGTERYATDPELASKLWNLSEVLTEKFK